MVVANYLDTMYGDRLKHKAKNKPAEAGFMSSAVVALAQW